MYFYDEQLESLEPGTDLSDLVSFIEKIAGRKLRKSEIKLLSTLYISQYMRGREQGWYDFFESIGEKPEHFN